MSSMEHAKNTLRKIVAAPDASFEIGEAALALASLDRPPVPLARFRRHVGNEAEDVSQ